MEILTHPHPLLRQVMPDVDIEQGRKTGLLLIEEVKNNPGIVGLAANQVGIKERVCCFAWVHGIIAAVVNPYIVEYSKETELEIEGCASLPDFKIYVERSVEIRVKFDDWFMSAESDNKVNHLMIRNFAARVLQHEVDHLNGILLTDKVLDAPSP
jgi:peptide deformylase